MTVQTSQGSQQAVLVQHSLDAQHGLNPSLPSILAYSPTSLLVLDNAETIFQRELVGQWRSGYEGYGQLLRTIGETPHQSYVLLTSREKPREMVLMEGEQALVRSLPLQRLSLA